MAVKAGGDSGEKSTFRWIDGARYALALVVTVVIVTVIAYAIKLVLRPEPLMLVVVGGAVSAKPDPQLDRALDFHFTLRAMNPSGRARLYYTNIVGYLGGRNPAASSSMTTTQATSYFLGFIMPDITVSQQATVDSYALPHGGINDSFRNFVPYFNMFYNNHNSSGRMPDAVLQLSGNLTTEIDSGYNTTARTAIYCCSHLTVSSDSSDEDTAEGTAGDVVCLEQQIKGSQTTETICINLMT